MMTVACLSYGPFKTIVAVKALLNFTNQNDTQLNGFKEDTKIKCAVTKAIVGSSPVELRLFSFVLQSFPTIPEVARGGTYPC